MHWIVGVKKWKDGIFQNSIRPCLPENQKDVLKVIQSIQRALILQGRSKAFAWSSWPWVAKFRKELREFYCFTNFLPLYSYLQFFFSFIHKGTNTDLSWMGRNVNYLELETIWEVLAQSWRDPFLKPFIPFRGVVNSFLPWKNQFFKFCWTARILINNFFNSMLGSLSGQMSRFLKNEVKLLKIFWGGKDCFLKCWCSTQRENCLGSTWLSSNPSWLPT